MTHRIGRAAALALAALTALAPAAAAIDALPEEPTSINRASLYHLGFATDIDGVPVEEGTVFAEGSPRVLTLVGWDRVPYGTELRLRVFHGDRLVFDDSRTVTHERASGYIFNYQPAGGVPAGRYFAQLDYNGVPDELASFEVLPAGSPMPPTTGSVQADAGAATQTGPVDYADPSDVLVVTRESVLRPQLGARTDAVLAAAARVGDLRDLEADGVTRDTFTAMLEETHRLLRAGDYRYLLILGNDDAVPYARFENLLGDEEREALEGWELPHEWVPSDNLYTDLDGDRFGVPDLAVARIPSSDDADLLLTQLGDNVTPDGDVFALINQKRRSMAGSVVETMDDHVPVETHYSPPVDHHELGGTGNGVARYTYVLLHGIGVTTDEWSGDVVAWSPVDVTDLAGPWNVRVGGQNAGITVSEAGSPGGIVNIGACYGGWTLDTTLAPQHKTADNNLALAYLKSGTRAFIADTHLSYSYLIGPDRTPVARTGFEMILWREMLAGSRPIDAFQTAKVEMGRLLREALAAGQPDAALLDYKHLHIMVYLGRP